MALLVTLGVCLALVAVVALVLSHMYNRLVMLRNWCDNGFAQIEVQLKRRHDLIQKLVEAVRGYLTHERETLENVISARNSAAAGLRDASKDPGNTAAMQAFIGNENTLTRALAQMHVLLESYPELKADESIGGLAEELSRTENRLAFSRQSYNDLVIEFNTYRQTFPTVLFAAGSGFASNRIVLEFSDSERIQKPPQVALV